MPPSEAVYMCCMVTIPAAHTLTVSPLPNDNSVPAKVTTAYPETFTSGDIVSDSSCPDPPENSKTPVPDTFAVGSKTKLPSLRPDHVQSNTQGEGYS